MAEEKSMEDRRNRDLYQDRRTDAERRQVYTPEFFDDGSPERRNGSERRQKGERRKDCVRVSDWTSVCVSDKEA